MPKKAKSSAKGSLIGIHFAPLSLPPERRLQTLALLIHLALFLIGPMIYSLIMFYLLFYTSNWKWIPLLYTAWYVYDYNADETGGRNFTPFRNWIFSPYMANYFPVKLIKTAELDPSQSYLLGYHPHGLLGFGAFLSFATNAVGFKELFPGITSRLITLAGNFKMPGTREILLSHGAISCTKQAIAKSLEVPKGQVSVLVVGGASEALNHGKKSIELVLNRRKGFVKLAIQSGRPLVPVFAFGENFLYDPVPNEKGTMLRNFQEWVEKNFSFAPAFFFGRGVFQYDWGFMPHRVPITVVVGKPFDVEQVEEPTNEQVQEVHTQYVKALVALFEEYNPIYGDKETSLVILE